LRSHTLLIAALVLLTSLATAAIPADANDTTEPALLHLRRGAFDPLAAPKLRTVTGASDLLLVQLDDPPGETTVAWLEASGLRPLWYVPDNAFLVRASGPSAGSLAKAQLGARWVGAFERDYKLAPELDGLLAAPDAAPVELRIVVAPDSDPATLAQDIVQAGGEVFDQAGGLNGSVLRVALPGAAIGSLAARGDVLWVEPYYAAAVLDDQARAIIGVPEAREQYDLTGAGQMIAVTDTGLDVQSNLSADFAGRVARGFSRQEMYAGCAALSSVGQPGTWSDLHGHGTHVAGMNAGTGALSDGLYEGVAPGARLVVQAVSSGGDTLDCLPNAESYLELAYEAGARIHNGSFGRRTGVGSCEYGCYTAEDATVDDFLWRHKDYLFVVAAGNSGRDVSPGDGVVDADSINSPATAKNVLSVGASENERAQAGDCLPRSQTMPTERLCWDRFGFSAAPLTGDFVSDNRDGIAAFSSRGPTDDGRIKPEIVAPGTNVISARSHQPGVLAGSPYDADYTYLSGTSMATPQVSGLAALVRQWLAQERLRSQPSAALLKALLLNGATSARPGQYGTVAEIPSAWPNSVEGWGRAAIGDTIGLGGEDRVWLAEHGGIATSQLAEYTVHVSAGEPLRVTLAWTDYPSAPGISKALVNDLDLQVIVPGGDLLSGNAAASLPFGCRVSGADRCNNVESVEIAAPFSGNYIIRVRGAAVPFGPQPFALVARGERLLDPALVAPTLQPVLGPGPALSLRWSAVAGASFYRVQISASSSFAASETQFTTQPSLVTIEQPGRYYLRVRACNASTCGEYSGTRTVDVTETPEQLFLPQLQR
jgi:subtilisin family serine protease